MAILPNKVNPGDLITAKFVNELIDNLADLNQRLKILEAKPPGGSVATAIGLIDVFYQGKSSRGVQLGINDPLAYPHTFTLVNQTDQTLIIQLQATVTALHGNWNDRVQIYSETNEQIRALTIGPSGSKNFIVAVTTASGVVIGEQALLKVSATVGAPHNKRDEATLALTIAQQAGEPVKRAIQVTGVEPSPNLNNVNPGGEPVSFAVGLRYSAAAPPNEIDALFRVKLVADNQTDIGEWLAIPPDFDGRQVQIIDDLTYETRIHLRSGAPVDEVVMFNLYTPNERGAIDKSVTLTATIESIGLEPALSVSTPSPLKIRLAKKV